MCNFKKQIPSFPNYYICEHGEILSRKTNYKKIKILKHIINQHNYHTVFLRKNGKQYNKRISNLVMETFVGAKQKGLEVDHIDGNRENDHLSNLRYVSRKENMEKAQMQKGSKQWNSKLNEQQVLEIRQKYKLISHNKSNAHELSIQYNISQSTINCIVRRSAWKHV